MRRVLLVEDDKQVLALLRKILQAPGDFQLADAPSASEAIAIVRQWTPDLILLDVLLARSTGYGFLAEFQKLRSDREVPDIPILLVSGLPLKELEGLKNAYPSVRGIYGKPFDIDSLRTAVYNWTSLQPQTIADVSCR